MRALKIFKTWISLYGICILGMSVCLVIILNSKKQVRELKQEFKNNVETIDSLTLQKYIVYAPADTAVIWFNDHRVSSYESIDTMVAYYDHGKELNIYFKYKN